VLLSGRFVGVVRPFLSSLWLGCEYVVASVALELSSEYGRLYVGEAGVGGGGPGRSAEVKGWRGLLLEEGEDSSSVSVSEPEMGWSSQESARLSVLALLLGSWVVESFKDLREEEISVQKGQLPLLPLDGGVS